MGLLFGSRTLNYAIRGARSMSTSIRVSEVFTSVQGEGPFTGRPSVFLRLGLCNLECIWCDTKFTWLFEEGQLKRIQDRVPEHLRDTVGDKFYDKKKELTRYDAPTLLEKIREASGEHNQVRSVVITGGEPLLHKEPLVEICNSLLESGYQIEMETNGTLSPDVLPRGIHYNVSVKLENSYNPGSKRLKWHVLEEFLALDSVLKFVVADISDVEEAKMIASRAKFPPHRVFLMPEATYAYGLALKGQWVVNQCLENGFNYSHRVHVSLWGDKRGV